MANTPLLFSGAETGNILLEASNATGSTSIVTSPTRAGSGARVYQCNPTTSAVGSILFDTFSASTGKNSGLNTNGALFASFYFRVDTLPASGAEIFCGWYVSTTNVTVMSTLRINSTGTIAIYDSTNTLITTGSTVLSTATWYRIDYKITGGTGGATGAYIVQINGSVEVSGTGNFTTSNIGNFSLGKIANIGSNTVNFYYDDVWIDSANFAPSTYGMVADQAQSFASNAWTTNQVGASSATISDVNAIPVVTTTFIEDPAGTAPVDVTMNMQTMSAMGISGATILGIMAWCYLKDTTTVANTVKMGIRSGSTDSLNTTGQNTSTTFVNFGRVIQNDPATSAAWTQSGLENVLFKVSEGTSAVNTQVAGTNLTVVFVPAVTSTSQYLPLLGVGS